MNMDYLSSIIASHNWSLLVATYKKTSHGLYPFSQTNFPDFSRTFSGLRYIFPLLLDKQFSLPTLPICLLLINNRTVCSLFVFLCLIFLQQISHNYLVLDSCVDLL